MDMNRIDGTVKSAVGKGEEFLGKIGDKPGVHAQGLADQVAGAAQTLYGRTKDGFNDAVDRIPDALSDAADLSQRAYKDGSRQVAAQVGKQPIETLLLVGALGYLVGWAVHRAAR
jgi:uncharacterized protein YjbJ (UPF0337 family)